MTYDAFSRESTLFVWVEKKIETMAHVIMKLISIDTQPIYG